MFAEAGFTSVRLDLRRENYEEDLRDIAATHRRRDNFSQLLAISDADYAAGLRRLEEDLRRPMALRSTSCILTISGDREQRKTRA